MSLDTDPEVFSGLRFVLYVIAFGVVLVLVVGLR
jgi:hypothetical protein